MNSTERRGIAAAVIAVTVGLIIVAIGIFIDGGGDSVDIADGTQRTTTQPPTALGDPESPSSPEQAQPPPTAPPPGELAPPSESAPPTDPSAPPTTLPPDLPLRPGEGVRVMVARSSDQADAVPAEVTSALLRELGYQPSSPEDLEVPDIEAYERLASEELDIWIAGRFPFDKRALKRQFKAEDATIGDLVTPVGHLAADGARLGLAIDRGKAIELGITSVAELLANPEAVETYDRNGNGRPEVIACNGEASCGDFLRVLERNNLLNRLDLIEAPDGDPGEEVLKRYRNGTPVLFVHHEPHWLASVLLMGGDLMWLSLNDRVAASPEVDQAECSSDPCRLGSGQVRDVRSVANTCFVDENPAAKALLEAITFDRLELAMFDAELRGGRDAFGVSAVWLEQNRDTVDAWLGAARLAAVQVEPEPCEGGGSSSSPA